MKDKKNKSNGTSQSTPKKTFKWRIIGSFSYKNTKYNIGDEVPKFLPKEEKEKLFKEGKLSKLYEDGTEEIYKTFRELGIDEIFYLVFNPLTIPNYLSRYIIDENSLRILLTNLKKANAEDSIIKMVEREIENVKNTNNN